MPTVAINTLTSGNSFLTSFNTATPKLYIAAETSSAADFDQETLRQWRDEGFEITYLPYGDGEKGARARFSNALKELHRSMGVGDSFGVVAFGDAAEVCMETFRGTSARLKCLVAYYPSSIPDPGKSFPIGIKVIVHLAGGEIGVTRAREVLGLQGKRRTERKKMPAGSETSGRLNLAYPSYTYEGVEPGFAEHDLDEYDKGAARLAWARSLQCVRASFGVETDLEGVWEKHLAEEFTKKDVDATMKTMVERPYVNHVPTMTGGMGHEDLRRFYDEYFIPGNPESLKMKLVSRTIGVDKIVDELYITFDHTEEMPWILPSLPPTNKHVEVALVCVVAIEGGKVCREHIYWDQASVLVQIGLLDPKHIPTAAKALDIKQLPVVGAESARKVLDETSEKSNKLLDDW